MEKICKNCEYYRNKFGYGQCYGQKNAPQVDDNECCEGFKERTDKINSEDFIKAFGKGVEEKSTTYREQFVGETDEQYGEYKKAHDNLFNNLEEELAKARIGFTKNDLKDAISDEFKYRASQGRTNYTMEEVIYIVNEVIDVVDWEENKVMPQDQSSNIDMQIRIIKGDIQYLSEKVDKLSSLIEEQETVR